MIWLAVRLLPSYSISSDNSVVRAPVSAALQPQTSSGSIELPRACPTCHDAMAVTVGDPAALAFDQGFLRAAPLRFEFAVALALGCPDLRIDCIEAPVCSLEICKGALLHLFLVERIAPAVEVLCHVTCAADGQRDNPRSNMRENHQPHHTAPMTCWRNP